MMKLGFRWFGEGNDNVTLNHIQQIPGVETIVWALHNRQPGEIWPVEEILEVQKQALQYGFNIDVVESVNIHEDIKLGLPAREEYIENYKQTIINLSKVGVKVICYNFMPVFDWTRSDLAKVRADGSNVLAYEKNQFEALDPIKMIEKMEASSSGLTLPGWEPERLKSFKRLFTLYKDVAEEDLFDNLKYFLQEIIPVAEAHDIKMAIHPDDPPWSVFGLPRIVKNRDDLERIIDLVDSPSNGLTICSGALGANPKNNLPEIMSYFSKKDRVAFAHIRNVEIHENGDFEETSHRCKDGSQDMYAILKALHDSGFNGYVRPDHGRMIWDEQGRPGYGLYDRALGAMYLLGIWDALERVSQEQPQQQETESKLSL